MNISTDQKNPQNNRRKNAKENLFYFILCTMYECIAKSMYKCEHAIRDCMVADADFGDILYNVVHKEAHRKRNSHHSVMLITMDRALFASRKSCRENLYTLLFYLVLGLSYPIIRVFLCRTQTSSHTELKREKILNHMKCRVTHTNRHE